MPTKSASRIITREPELARPGDSSRRNSAGRLPQASRTGAGPSRGTPRHLAQPTERNRARQAWDHRGYGAAAVAPAQNVGAALDAAAGRLGSAPSLAAGEAQGVVRNAVPSTRRHGLPIVVAGNFDAPSPADILAHLAAATTETSARPAYHVSRGRPRTHCRQLDQRGDGPWAAAGSRMT